LTSTDPSKALLEINLIQNKNPEYYSAGKLHSLKARSYESMGERNRAKAEYMELLGTDYDGIAKAKIVEFESKEKQEKELQELGVKLNQPRNDIVITPNTPFRHLTIVIINVILIILIIYSIHKWRKSKK
jgi:hypothetical protein